MRIAALDLGTNTFLCLIAEVKDGSISAVLSDEQEIVRLGEGVAENEKFHPEALNRAAVALSKFQMTMKRFQVSRVLAVATAAARNVKNVSDFISVCDSFEIPVRVVDGSFEAHLTFYGALFGYPSSSKSVVIDVGGGSTEFILGHKSELIWSKSLHIGCVFVTETFLHHELVTSADLLLLREKLSRVFENELGPLKKLACESVMAVAGTPTTLAALELGGFNETKVQGFILTQELLEHWINILYPLSTEQKIERFNLPKSRADVLLAGTVILSEALKFLKKDRMIVSTKGVRYGLAMEMAASRL